MFNRLLLDIRCSDLLSVSCKQTPGTLPLLDTEGEYKSNEGVKIIHRIYGFLICEIPLYQTKRSYYGVAGLDIELINATSNYVYVKIQYTLYAFL